jgi:hypothetical protein
VLDFVCFLLRYYKDIEYTDLTADSKTLSKIRKAELERSILGSLIINKYLGWTFKTWHSIKKGYPK